MATMPEMDDQRVEVRWKVTQGDDWFRPFRVLDDNGTVVANVDLPAGETHWATLGGLLLVGGSTSRCDLLIGSNDPADMTDHGLTVQFVAAPADMHVGS